MKKIILLLALSFPIFLSAQLTSDDFESYSVGAFDSQWDATQWEGWAGAISNSTISNEQAHQGVNSLKIETNNDVVALLAPLNAETYEVSYWQYVPSGNGAYTNIQYDYTTSASAFFSQVYVGADGAGRIQVNSLLFSYPFDVVFDQWVQYRYVFNFITNQGQFIYNNATVVTFSTEFSIQSAPIEGQVNAINFFGTCEPTGCTSLAYYDDVEVTYVPAEAFNAEVLNPIPPSEYTTVPSGLAKPLRLETSVRNIGLQDITDVSVTFNLKNGSGTTIFSETTAPVASISSGEQASFVGIELFTLTEDDNFTMDYEVNIAEADGDIADNISTLQVPFTIDDNMYARDNGNFLGGGVLANRQITFGQAYDFIEMATIDGILIGYEASAVGEIVNGFIYSLDSIGMPDSIIATAEPFSISEVGTAGSPVFITLDFAEDVELMPGEYGFAIEQTDTVSLNLSISPEIYTPMKAWARLPNTDGILVWSNLEIFNIRAALAIRPLIKAVGVSTDEAAVNYVNELHISPNPTQDIITIDLELLETQDLTVAIYNTNGQQLQTFSDNRTIGGQYQLNLKEYPSGVYFVQFQIGEQLMSRRVVLAK